MKQGSPNRVMQDLCQTMLRPEGASLTDAQLVGYFVERRDSAAFEALLHRHGPMVLSLCRRVLWHHQDAEDAFQATFLVFVRKAVSIKPREMLPNWLYGVAYQTALKARAIIGKRRAKEKQVRMMPEPVATEPDIGRDLERLLDQELSRLPDKYRVPIVLCDLEGKSRREAARLLNWQDGTLSGRLARGRKMLAARLAKHGLSVTACSLAALVPSKASACAVPTALKASTVKSASLLLSGQPLITSASSAQVTAFAEGALKTMLLKKMRFVAVVLTASLITVVGVGLFAQDILHEQLINAPKHVELQPPQPTQKDKTSDPVNKDGDLLQGRWKTEKLVIDGSTIDVMKSYMEVNGTKFMFSVGKETISGSITADSSKKLHEIDFKTKEWVHPLDGKWTPTGLETRLRKGIFTIEKNVLSICLAKSRPESFPAQPGEGYVLLVFRREDEQAPAPGVAEKPKGSGAQPVDKKAVSEKEANQTDEERRQIEIQIETQKLRSLFAGGLVDVYVDGDPTKPFIKGGMFSRIVEVSGRRFLEFRVQQGNRQVRELIDPTRIAGMRVTD